MAGGHWKRARAIVEPACRSVSMARKCDFVAWSRIQLAFGDAAGALAAADAAIAIDAKRGDAYLARGRALEAVASGERTSTFANSQRYGQARKAYEQAVELSAKKQVPLDALALFYASAPRAAGGSERRAREAAGQIEPIDPVAADLTRAAILDWTTQRTEIERNLDEALRREPQAYRTNIAEATFESRFKQWQAAARAAATAARADAGRVAPYSLLAVADVEQKDLAALDEVLREAAREVPDDRSPDFFAARALIGLNVDPARARRYLDAYEGQPPEAGAPSLHDAEKLRAQLSVLTRAR